MDIIGEEPNYLSLKNQLFVLRDLYIFFIEALEKEVNEPISL